VRESARPGASERVGRSNPTFEPILVSQSSPQIPPVSASSTRFERREIGNQIGMPDRPQHARHQGIRSSETIDETVTSIEPLGQLGQSNIHGIHRRPALVRQAQQTEFSVNSRLDQIANGMDRNFRAAH